MALEDLAFCQIRNNSFINAMKRKAPSIIVPIMISVPPSMLNISAKEMFCHMDSPHKESAAREIPARMAAVFLRTFNSENIKIGLVV